MMQKKCSGIAQNKQAAGNPHGKRSIESGPISGIVQVEMEETGIPKGMNHIIHMTKVGMGKELVW